jgi:hypothetical protein
MDLIELTLDGLVVDDDQRAVFRRQQMVGPRVADGLACHGFSSSLTGRTAGTPGFLGRRGYVNDPFHDR